MNYTSIEQSKQLIEAGLDPNTADMSFYDGIPQLDSYKFNKLHEELMGRTNIEVLPCWSIGALIELMPHAINTYWLCITKTTLGNNVIDYMKTNGEELFTSDKKERLIDAAFETIRWLLENNYIEKGETK